MSRTQRSKRTVASKFNSEEALNRTHKAVSLNIPTVFESTPAIPFSLHCSFLFEYSVCSDNVIKIALVSKQADKPTAMETIVTIGTVYKMKPTLALNHKSRKGLTKPE